MDALYAIVGLGNPGAEYARTRHNIGFMAVERFGEKHGAVWLNERKFESRVARVDAAGKEAFLSSYVTTLDSLSVVPASSRRTTFRREGAALPPRMTM